MNDVSQKRLKKIMAGRRMGGLLCIWRNRRSKQTRLPPKAPLGHITKLQPGIPSIAMPSPPPLRCSVLLLFGSAVQRAMADLLPNLLGAYDEPGSSQQAFRRLTQELHALGRRNGQRGVPRLHTSRAPHFIRMRSKESILPRIFRIFKLAQGASW